AYYDGWKLGLKALAIYRDGSKDSQPLNTKLDGENADEAEATTPKPRRERLPDTRQSVTHKFSVAGHEGYITVGLYPDGRPGELFITMAKEGSTIGGLMDAFGTSVSMSLQYGVPLEDYVRKFSHMRFEPQGHTKNPDIRIAKSIIDYIFRWLGIEFRPGYKEVSLGGKPPEGPGSPPAVEDEPTE
ncbi:MAG: vitamin B12-dependent ribonucleotide reductase, partial [Planctomycetota bacterium]